jgi:hypothetical protein
MATLAGGVNGNGQKPLPSKLRSNQNAVDQAVQSPFVEIGASGLKRFSGYVTGDDAYLPNLSFWESIQVFTDMFNNEPVVGASLLAIEYLIRQTDWYVDPVTDSAEDMAAKNFLEECINDMSTSWVETISEILTFLQFGWAYHEMVFKRRNGMVDSDEAVAAGDNSKYDDGKIGWRKIALRAQETLLRWGFDDDGGITGMWQIAPPDYEITFVPISRCLLFRTNAKKNDPQGRSILRSAYRPYYFKRRFEEIEGVGIERDLAGLPMATVDPMIMSPEATEDQKKQYEDMKQLVSQVRRDQAEGIIIPALYDELGNKMYEFTLLSASGNRQFDIGGVIQRKATEIAMCMMTDFIMLGHEGVGSYALASDKTTMFGNAIGVTLDIIASQFNDRAVPKLFYLNGMPTDNLPKLKHGDVKAPDLQSLSVYITACVQAGLITPDDTLLSWIRQQGTMPAPDNPHAASEQPPQIPGMPGVATQMQMQNDMQTQQAQLQAKLNPPQPPMPPGGGKMEGDARQLRPVNRYRRAE